MVKALNSDSSNLLHSVGIPKGRALVVSVSTFWREGEFEKDPSFPSPFRPCRTAGRPGVGEGS